MFNRKLKARIAELEAKLKESRRELHILADFRTHDRRVINRLKGELSAFRYANGGDPQPPVNAEVLASIKFKALFDGVFQPTHFKLGLGPCGKTVTRFGISFTDREMTIFQYHDDGTHKEFIYRRSDIDGRIQKDYETVTLRGEDARKHQESEAVRKVLRHRHGF